MSEYWKSTPKYYCKYCKQYVRDTAFEKRQHEATGRHQGNLSRFLRDLHKGHEREERDQDRVKQEVERLNGVVGTPGASRASAPNPALRSRQQPPPPQQRAATAEERKRQLAQLADMGVSVPDQYRKDMAMAGEWQTVSSTPIMAPKGEDGDDEEEDEKKSKMQIAWASDKGEGGSFKRKLERHADQEGLEDEETPRKRNWGSEVKAYPGRGGKDEGDADLDALLNGPDTWNHAREEDGAEEDVQIKREVSPDSKAPPEETGEVVFKKRKAKNVRQR